MNLTRIEDSLCGSMAVAVFILMVSGVVSTANSNEITRSFSRATDSFPYSVEADIQQLATIPSLAVVEAPALSQADKDHHSVAVRGKRVLAE